MNMTGRDLINYILENRLEDHLVFQDGEFIGFITSAEAAEKCGVGECTIRVWISRGLIDGIRINDVIYVPANFKPPMEEKYEKEE